MHTQSFTFNASHANNNPGYVFHPRSAQDTAQPWQLDVSGVGRLLRSWRNAQECALKQETHFATVVPCADTEHWPLVQHCPDVAIVEWTTTVSFSQACERILRLFLAAEGLLRECDRHLRDQSECLRNAKKQPDTSTPSMITCDHLLHACTWALFLHGTFSLPLIQSGILQQQLAGASLDGTLWHIARQMSNRCVWGHRPGPTVFDKDSGALRAWLRGYSLEEATVRSSANAVVVDHAGDSALTTQQRQQQPLIPLLPTSLPPSLPAETRDRSREDAVGEDIAEALLSLASPVHIVVRSLLSLATMRESSTRSSSSSSSSSAASPARIAPEPPQALLSYIALHIPTTRDVQQWVNSLHESMARLSCDHSHCTSRGLYVTYLSWTHHHLPPTLADMYIERPLLLSTDAAAYMRAVTNAYHARAHTFEGVEYRDWKPGPWLERVVGKYTRLCPPGNLVDTRPAAGVSIDLANTWTTVISQAYMWLIAQDNGERKDNDGDRTGAAVYTLYAYVRHAASDLCENAGCAWASLKQASECLNVLGHSPGVSAPMRMALRIILESRGPRVANLTAREMKMDPVRNSFEKMSNAASDSIVKTIAKVTRDGGKKTGSRGVVAPRGAVTSSRTRVGSSSTVSTRTRVGSSSSTVSMSPTTANSTLPTTTSSISASSTSTTTTSSVSSTLTPPSTSPSPPASAKRETDCCDDNDIHTLWTYFILCWFAHDRKLVRHEKLWLERLREASGPDGHPYYTASVFRACNAAMRKRWRVCNTDDSFNSTVQLHPDERKWLAYSIRGLSAMFPRRSDRRGWIGPTREYFIDAQLLTNQLGRAEEEARWASEDYILSRPDDPLFLHPPGVIRRICFQVRQLCPCVLRLRSEAGLSAQTPQQQPQRDISDSSYASHGAEAAMRALSKTNTCRLMFDMWAALYDRGGPMESTREACREKLALVRGGYLFAKTNVDVVHLRDGILLVEPEFGGAEPRPRVGSSLPQCGEPVLPAHLSARSDASASGSASSNSKSPAEPLSLTRNSGLVLASTTGAKRRREEEVRGRITVRTAVGEPRRNNAARVCFSFRF